MASSNCIMAGARHPFIINVIGWQVSCLSPSTYFFSNPLCAAVNGKNVPLPVGQYNGYSKACQPPHGWVSQEPENFSCLKIFSKLDCRHVTVLRGHDSLYDVSPGFFWLNPYGPATKPRFSLHVVGAHPKYAGDLMPVCMLGAIP